jgi:prolyl-tRNA synthetase
LPMTFEGYVNLPEKVEMPNVGKIEDVAKLLGIQTRQLVKTLIYVADKKPFAVLLPGNRDVNEIKLNKLFPGAELADPETIRQVTGAEVGFAGPIGLKIPVVADRSLKGLKGGVTGANETDMHLRNVDLERDAGITDYVDVALAYAGDLAPNGVGRLVEKRGVEVGHVFKLGTKYSEALGANFLDENGKSHPAVMGCYGIGVSRTLQAVIEQSNDANGIIWPISVAPFELLITVLSPKDETCMKLAEDIKTILEAQGVDVLLDDREERPGFKFKDADLLGLPLRLTIGERGLAKGEVELKARTDKDFEAIPAEVAAVRVFEKITAMREAL